jgi:hypothetical protein
MIGKRSAPSVEGECNQRPHDGGDNQEEDRHEPGEPSDTVGRWTMRIECGLHRAASGKSQHGG